jgi:hypothetical protein
LLQHILYTAAAQLPLSDNSSSDDSVHKEDNKHKQRPVAKPIRLPMPQTVVTTPLHSSPPINIEQDFPSLDDAAKTLKHTQAKPTSVVILPASTSNDQLTGAKKPSKQRQKTDDARRNSDSGDSDGLVPRAAQHRRGSKQRRASPNEDQSGSLAALLRRRRRASNDDDDDQSSGGGKTDALDNAVDFQSQPIADIDELDRFGFEREVLYANRQAASNASNSDDENKHRTAFDISPLTSAAGGGRGAHSQPDEDDDRLTMELLSSSEDEQCVDEHHSTASGRQIDDDQMPTNAVPLSLSETDSIGGGVLHIPDAAHAGFYIEHMPHTSACIDHLPWFPSWSLVCRGPASLYTHSRGLHGQPGFVQSTSYLQPYYADVRVASMRVWRERLARIISGASGPGRQAIREMSSNKVRRRRAHSYVSTCVQVNLKLYVGYEYECARGHRFIQSAPDAMLKHAGGVVGPREQAPVRRDMPLWTRCVCREQPRVPAQLMRLHVVTPKAPVRCDGLKPNHSHAQIMVQLHPRVQPDIPCTGLSESDRRGLTDHHQFTLGFGAAPAYLQHARYYILRLPYVYVRPDGHHYLPPNVETQV